MGIEQKVEDLAAKIGSDVHTLWDKFEAFVAKETEGKKEESSDHIQTKVGAPSPIYASAPQPTGAANVTGEAGNVAVSSAEASTASATTEASTESASSGVAETTTK